MTRKSRKKGLTIRRTVPSQKAKSGRAMKALRISTSISTLWNPFSLAQYLRNGHLAIMAKAGTIYLVGAGPGDPDLLTLRAARLIESARLIVHDGLVDPTILALAHPHARLVSVAKSRARHTLPQDAINAILGGVVSGGTLSGVHAVSHISAGVVGASYLAMQLQTLLGGAGTAPSSSSPPSPPLSTI